MSLVYHHVSRSTANLERVLAFYQALGCTVDKRVRDEVQHLERVVLTLPGSNAHLQLIAVEGGPVAPPAPAWPDHLAFHSADFDGDLALMQASSGQLAGEPYRLSPTSGRIAFVLDPDGHRVELVEK